MTASLIKMTGIAMIASMVAKMVVRMVVVVMGMGMTIMMGMVGVARVVRVVGEAVTTTTTRRDGIQRTKISNKGGEDGATGWTLFSTIPISHFTPCGLVRTVLCFRRMACLP